MSILMRPPYAMLAGSTGAALGGIPDTTAPTLTFPTNNPLSDTTAYLQVTTNEANGTLYYVVTTSATPPSAAQVKAGQNNGGTAAVFAGSQAVSATGAQVATATGLTSNTLYYPYFMHEDAVGNQSAVKGLSSLTTLTTGTSDTDFDNLIAAMSVPPTDLRKGYIARMIQALYASGTWAKADVMWVLAAHDEQAARLNWKAPGTFTLTAVNSPTFTTDRGFAGNGSTSYLDTAWDWATNGVQFTQNNCHISIYQRTSSGNNSPCFGHGFTGNPRVQISGRTGTSTANRMNSGTSVTGPAGGSLPQQALSRRNDAINSSYMRDGVQVTVPTAAASVTTSNTVDMTFGVASTGYTADQMSIGTLGAYLDDTEALAFYTACNAYMVALGADT